MDTKLVHQTTLLFQDARSHINGSRDGEEGYYKMHQFLWAAFPSQDELVNFRFYQDGNTVIVRSVMEPDWTKCFQNKEFLLVDDPRMINLCIDHPKGTILKFMLNANPTKCKTKADKKKRVPISREWEQINWLDRQGIKGGFVLAKENIDAKPVGLRHDYKQRPARVKVTDDLVKSLGDGWSSLAGQAAASVPKQMTFYLVKFTGEMMVTDTEKFRQTMINGLGRGKGFGFGLLLVRK